MTLDTAMREFYVRWASYERTVAAASSSHTVKRGHLDLASRFERLSRKRVWTPSSQKSKVGTTDIVPRLYYFHVRNADGTVDLDLQGEEFADLNEVMEEVVHAARGLLINDLGTDGILHDQRSFEVRDAEGTLSLVYEFRKAFRCESTPLL